MANLAGKVPFITGAAAVLEFVSTNLRRGNDAAH
jgi:hypothetical protein